VKCGAIHRDGASIVPHTWRADNAWSRLRGLLGRKPLRADAQQALWLVPCGGIHTFGMRYSLDVVFLDRAGRVLACRQNVRPWRMRACRGAWQTVELAAGGIEALRPNKGEVWQWQGE
jgi:uncharacterized membrane protein (UPF0127 family)